jgi:hypothetical protein
MSTRLDWSDLEVEAVEVANSSSLGVEMLVGSDGLAVGRGMTEVGASCLCCQPYYSCSCGPPGCCTTCCPGCAATGEIPKEPPAEWSGVVGEGFGPDDVQREDPAKGSTEG